MNGIIKIKIDGQWVDIPAMVGSSPIKGVDYFTEADKQEIINAVLAALPAAEEASF